MGKKLKFGTRGIWHKPKNDDSEARDVKAVVLDDDVFLYIFTFEKNHSDSVPRNHTIPHADFTPEDELEKPYELKLPIEFNKGLGIFFDKDNRMVAMMRGWGWIQYKKKPEKLQDDIGQYIADCVNKN